MAETTMTRKEFLYRGVGMAAYVASPLLPLSCGSDPEADPPDFIDDLSDTTTTKTDAVAVARVDHGDIGRAVEEAVDLLGGIDAVSAGKDRIMLKPNLVSEDHRCITKPAVVRRLAELLRAAGKDVCIGEGSATGWRYNANRHGKVCRLWNEEKLNQLQEYVFEETGYKRLAGELGTELVNLHTGDMVTRPVPDGFVYDEITMLRRLSDIDMLCSVPMMKTHSLTTVTLGIKNLFGVLPGTEYGSVRAHVHDLASEVESTGTDSVLIDLLKVNKTGLVVVDGSTAMQGQGPIDGTLVEMNLIIAGTNPLATDMVCAALMGFGPDEVPTFSWAQRAGFLPSSLRSIELRGVPARKAWKRFVRPSVVAWKLINESWGNELCARRRPNLATRFG